MPAHGETQAGMGGWGRGGVGRGKDAGRCGEMRAGGGGKGTENKIVDIFVLEFLLITPNVWYSVYHNVREAGDRRKKREKHSMRSF